MIGFYFCCSGLNFGELRVLLYDIRITSSRGYHSVLAKKVGGATSNFLTLCLVNKYTWSLSGQTCFQQKNS